MDKTRVMHGETKYHAAWANSVGMLDKTPQRFDPYLQIACASFVAMSVVNVFCHSLSFEGLGILQSLLCCWGIWMCVMLAYVEFMKMTGVVYSIMVPAFACFCWQTVWEIVYSNEQQVVLVGNSRYQISLKCVALTCSLQASLFSLQVSATIVPMSSVKLSSCASSFEVRVRSQVSNSWIAWWCNTEQA